MKSASYAGIEFFVSESKETYGRRNAVFEFSNRDTPYVQGLGRKARRFSVEGFFTGEAAEHTAKRFIESCETLSESDLIHPFLDETLLVTLDDSLEISRHSRDRNYISFSANFIEKGSKKPVVKPLDTNLIDSSKSLIDSAKEGLGKALNIAEMTRNQIDQLTDFIHESTEFIRESARITTMSALALNEIGYSLKRLENEITNTLNAPFEAADLLSASLKSLKAFEFNKLRKLKAFSMISGNASSRSGLNDSIESDRLEKNKNAVSNFLALTAGGFALSEIHHMNSGDPDPEEADPWEFSHAQKSLAVSEFISSESDPEAVSPEQLSESLEQKIFISYGIITELREQLAETLENLSDTVSDDPVLFPASLNAVTAIKTTELSEKRFPRTIRIEVKQDVPLKVFSYHYRQNPDLLLELNQPEFPYYIQAGTEMEVIENVVTKNQ